MSLCVQVALARLRRQLVRGRKESRHRESDSEHRSQRAGPVSGFVLIAVAALLSTGSAINATLYGAARVSFIIAKDGELPAVLERKVWHRPVMGLLLTARSALLVANIFDLSSISVMGSAGFLLIFAGVNAANVRLRKHTQSRGWLSAAGGVACLAALGALVWQRATVAPRELWVLAIMVALAVAVEGSWRWWSGRKIRTQLPRRI